MLLPYVTKKNKKKVNQDKLAVFGKLVTKKRRNKNEVKKIPVSELIEHLESGWNYGKGEN